MVPGARVELAWISPNDFESFASTIPPAGQPNYYIYKEEDFKKKISKHCLYGIIRID